MDSDVARLELDPTPLAQPKAQLGFLGPAFTLAVFLSAALLFIVEPMFGKMVLPLLGGSPAVWTTCMLFFQGALLLGYWYAHVFPGWLGLRRHTFVHSYEESAKTLLNNYLDNVEAFCNKARLRDPITDEEVEPDERLMRAIEEQIGVTETAKKAFREEILIRLSALARRGQRFEYTSHDRLREAIEKKLFADLRDGGEITTS